MQLSEEMQPKVRDLDSLLQPLGGFGKFQITTILCMCSMICLCAFSELGFVFTAGQVDHRCLIPECEGRKSGWIALDKPWLSAYIPKKPSGEYYSCLRNNVTLDKCSNNTVSTGVYQCDQLVYKTKEWTIARESWGVICDRDRYFLTLVGSLNNAGQVVGSLFIGYLSDRYGRKVVVTMTLLVSILGIIKSFSSNYSLFVILEFLGATMAIALFNIPFVFALEVVDPTKRVLASTILFIAYPTGEILVGLTQYLTFEWRATLRILHAPFLLAIAYYWVFPESIRWLLNKQRAEEAEAVLHKISQDNRSSVTDQTIKETVAQEVLKKDNTAGNDGRSEFYKLWSSRKMRIRVTAWLLIWLCTTFVFFGMTLNSVSISDDKFQNFILTALIEMPAYILMYILLGKVGRRFCMSNSLLLCGIPCFFDAFIPNDTTWGWAKIILYLTGKFGTSMSYFALDLYTTEMFPTSMRSSMMMIGMFVGKFATILAPQIPLLADIYTPLPLLIFGAMATSAGLSALVFPETQGCKLPDTMEEAENLGQNVRRDTLPL